jgi:trk system potassium uptake protein TrkA
MDARIAAIFRRDQPVFPEGETRVEAGDEVFLLAAAEHIRPVLRQLRRMVTPVQRIMIAGGGNIGCASPSHWKSVTKSSLLKAEGACRVHCQ